MTFSVDPNVFQPVLLIDVAEVEQLATELTPTLEEQIVAAGFTLGSIAEQLGVSPVLLARVNRQRQPLPITLRDQIATLIGVLPSELFVHSITPVDNSVTRRPLPARPILGESLGALQLARTVIPQPSSP